MRWIRGPLWDICWIWSGLPIGLAGAALALFSPPALLWFFTFVVLLETGHSLSPIVLAWSHCKFRRLMLEQPRKYILLPLAVFGVAVGIGASTSAGWTSYVNARGQMFRVTDLTNPLPILAWTYWAWNIYHFGMQNFGIASLYRCGRRGPRMFCCLVVTAFGMAVLPRLVGGQWMFFVGFGVFSIGHWMQDIGLSSQASGRPWLFIGVALLLGSAGFLWLDPRYAPTMLRVVPVILGARFGLGFVHFLYSRWVWRFSDERVRRTIGRDLLHASALCSGSAGMGVRTAACSSRGSTPSGAITSVQSRRRRLNWFAN